jgi:putative DNA primase/helicase
MTQCACRLKAWIMPSNLVELEAVMRDVISSSGLVPPDYVHLDGSIHRFDGETSRGKKRNCWYVGYPSPVPVITFGDWKSGFRSKYIHTSKPVSTTERSLLNAQFRELKTQRERKQNDEYRKAALKARAEWKYSVPVKNHSYLDAKRVPAYRLRVNKDDTLLVPVTNGNHIQSLQYIQSDGTKKFISGGKVKGHYYPVGMTDNPDRILICEGIATGLTLYEDTQLPTFVAFNAGNLVPVSIIIRCKYPGIEILICGDNDHTTEGNPGKTKAIEAAALCGGDWVVPDFTGLNSGPKDTDFNDLKRLKESCHE